MSPPNMTDFAFGFVNNHGWLGGGRRLPPEPEWRAEARRLDNADGGHGVLGSSLRCHARRQHGSQQQRRNMSTHHRLPSAARESKQNRAVKERSRSQHLSSRPSEARAGTQLSPVEYVESWVPDRRCAPSGMTSWVRLSNARALRRYSATALARSITSLGEA